MGNFVVITIKREVELNEYKNNTDLLLINIFPFNSREELVLHDLLGIIGAST